MSETASRPVCPACFYLGHEPSGCPPERIRARKTYALFERLYGVVAEPQNGAEDVLRAVWEEFDRRHSFGSYTHASYALESLEQVLRDQQEAGCGDAEDADLEVEDWRVDE